MAKKTDIRLRRSNVANAIPGAANLSEGELAINTMDGALYFKKSNGTVITAHDDTIMHVNSSTNRVGIGTTSPDYPLEIKTENSILLKLTTTASDKNARILFAPNDDEKWNIGANVSNEDFTFFDIDASSTPFKIQQGAATNTLVVDNDSRVGIGTAAANVVLHINHTNPNVRLQESDVTNGMGDIIYNSGRLRLRSRADTSRGGIAFEGYDGTTVTEYARFNNAGNLGIGTNNPGEPLHIKHSDPKIKLEDSDGTNQVGTIFQAGDLLTFQSRNNTSNGSIKFTGYNGTSGLEYARFKASGYFGIGTTNALSRLNVKGTQGNWRVDPDSVSGEIQVLATTTANDGFRDYRIRTNQIIFDTNGSEKMRLDTSGNLLLGKTSPGVASLGFEARDDGILAVNRDSATPVYFGRQTDDGAIIEFRKDTTVVGSIGTAQSSVYLGGSSNGGIYINGQTDIRPWNTSTQANLDNLMSLGSTSARFHDAHFGGTVAVGENIGINTTSPARRLEVNHHGSTIGMRLTRGDNAGNSLMEFANTGGVKNIIGHDAGRTAFVIGPSTTPTVTIKNSTGYVGIGTDSPGTGLTVQQDWVGDHGSINISHSQNTLGGIGLRANNVYKGGLIYRDGTQGAFWELTAYGNEPLLFKTNNAERMRISNAGNVGIGDTSPGFKLAIRTPAIPSGSTYAWPLDLSRPNTDNRGLTFGVAASGTTNAIAGHNADVGIGHTFGTDSNGLPTYYETLRISHVDQAVGKVGIGTSTPDVLLDLQMQNASEGLKIRRHNSSSQFIHIHEFDGSSHRIEANGSKEFLIDNQGTSATTKLVFKNAGSTAMLIDSSQNVGIGDTSPDRKVSIIGDSTSNGQYPLSLDATNTDYTLEFRRNGQSEWWIKQAGSSFNIHENGVGDHFRIAAGGNIGIGNTNPGVPLDVTSNSSAQGIRVRGRSADDIGQIDLANNGGTVRSQLQWNNSFFNIKALAAIPMIFYTNSTERMRIQSSGKVGIGTTSPDSLLSVTSTTINSEDVVYLKSGADNVNDYLGIAWEIGVGGNGPHAAIRSFAGPSGSDARLGFLTTSNGGTTLTEGLSIAHNSYVGIGTDSPASKLHIKNTVSEDTAIILENTNNAQNLNIDYYSNAGSVQSRINYAEGPAAWNFIPNVSNSNSALYIAYDAKVGIGTTSPSGAKLHVAGGVKATDLIAHDSTGINLQTDEGTKRLVVADNGAITFNQAYTFPTSDGSAGQVLKTDGSGNLTFQNDSGGGSAGSSITDTDNDTKIQVEESADEDIIRFDIAGSQKMLLNSTELNLTGDLIVSGNFNIAGDINSTSVTNLDVTDKTITVANNAGSAANANGAGIVVDTGTNNPQMIYTSATDEWDFNRSIHVSGASGSGVKINSGGAIVGGGATGGDTQLIYWGGGPVYYGRSSLGGTVSGHEFRVGGVTKLNVNSSGDTIVSNELGINTSSPSAKLHIVNNDTALDSILLETTEDTNSAGPVLTFKRNSSSPADADYLGQLKFKGENDAGQGGIVYAKITGKILDASNGTEDGLIEFANRKAGSNTITARLRSDSLQLLNGTALTVGGDITINSFSDEILFGSSSNKFGYASWLMSASGGGQIKNVAGPLKLNPDDYTSFEINDVEHARLDGSNFDIESGGFRVNDSGNNYPFAVTQHGYMTSRSASIAQLNATGDHANVPLSILADVNTTRTANYVEVGDIGSAANRFKIDNTGAVVINTTGGDAQLYLGGSSGTSRMYLARSGLDSLLYNVSNGNLRFGTNNAERMRIDNAGLVTVSKGGSTAAHGDTDLLVRHSSAASTTAQAQILAGNTGFSNLFFSDTDSYNAGGFIYNHASNYLAMNTNGSERIRITNDGKVGIGTTAPTTKLDVSGGSILSRNVNNASVRVNSTSNAYMIIDRSAANRRSALVFSTAASDIMANPPATGTIDWALGVSDSDELTGDKFCIASGNTNFSSAEFVIDSSGNVGIGTTTPSANLEVEDSSGSMIMVDDTNGRFIKIRSANNGSQNANISSYSGLYLGGSDNAGHMLISNSGDVGIGTTSPGTKLELSDDTDGQVDLFRLRNADSTYAQTMTFSLDTSKNLVIHSSSSAGGIINDIGSNGFVLKENGTQHIKFTANKMHVTGDMEIDASGDIILDGDGADVILKDGGTEYGRFTQLIGSLAIGAGSPGGTYPMLVSSNKVLFFKDINLGDNEKIQFGDGATGNLQIFHDGTDSFLDDIAEGNLILRTNGTSVKMMTGAENMVVATKDGSVDLYYDNSKKFETTSAGVNVTGEVETDTLNVGDHYNIDTASTTTSATTQVSIKNFPKATFRSARFTIQITNTTDSTYHSTEILAVHDGTTANITEFGEVHTGSSVEATFDADINGSNFRLLATPTSTDSMTFKVVVHAITV